MAVVAIGAVLLGVAVTVAILLAARRRRSSWSARLAAATTEITWFARQLIPQLERQESHEQVHGAWQVTQGRVSTLEDALTGLETTAPDDREAARSRGLRDAVRAARERIDAMVHGSEAAWPPTDITTTRNELGAARATLESALIRSEPGRPNDAGEHDAGATEQ